jgi:transposase
VSKPQVIDDAPHERVYERVAATDVAKKEGVVCLRLPHPAQPQGRRSVVWTVLATMSAAAGLAGRLAAEGVQKVTLESASGYWRIWFYVLEAGGLSVQLVNASQARSLPGRPKTDRLDAMWLARLTELGLLRPSFVPPAPVRALRGYARARTRLTWDKTRCWARLEKLLEDALIKVTPVASKITTESVQDMIRALIAGERDPQVPAGLARSRMRSRRDALAQALEGMFKDHHAGLAQLLLDQIAFTEGRITRLDILISEQLACMPAARGIGPGGETGPGEGAGPGAIARAATARLDEIPGISAGLAAPVISETGLDMTQFPAAARLVSWAGLCGRTIRSGPRTRTGKGQGNSYLRGYLCQAAIAAARTSTFLGERYRRTARRRGAPIAQVAVARSILTIVWHLLADPTARHHDLGPGHYQARTDKTRKARNHIRQLEALGYAVTITQAA